MNNITMVFRLALVLLLLALALVFARVDIGMKSMKADKKNADMAKFTGYCDYDPEDLEEDADAESLNITLRFDREVQKFKAKGMKVLEEDGNDFLITNSKPIKSGKFGVSFSLSYDMTDRSCYGLTGTCGCLKIEEAEEARKMAASADKN